MDCGRNARVGPTATDVALHSAYNFGVGGVGESFEKSDGAEDHPRRAPAALHGLILEECLLHGV